MCSVINHTLPERTCCSYDHVYRYIVKLLWLCVCAIYIVVNDCRRLHLHALQISRNDITRYCCNRNRKRRVYFLIKSMRSEMTSHFDNSSELEISRIRQKVERKRRKKNCKEQKKYEAREAIEPVVMFVSVY